MTRRAVTFLGVVLVGCTAGPDRGITDVTATPRFAASGAQQRVTGRANIRLPSLGNEKYSNSAIRHADGTVSGQFELRTDQVNGGRIHGSIICFTITGTSARLAGLIDQSTTPLAPVGSYVVWTVFDNGEGKNAPPDATSDLFPATAAEAAAHCAVGYDLAPFYPVLGGNLQVHP